MPENFCSLGNDKTSKFNSIINPSEFSQRQQTNHSKSFSSKNMPSYNYKNPPAHDQDFLRIPKRNENAVAGIGKHQQIKQDESRKKTFFPKSDSKAPKTGGSKTGEINNNDIQVMNQKFENKMLLKVEENSYIQNKEPRFLVSKSPIRNKTQNFTNKQKYQRVSELPTSYNDISTQNLKSPKRYNQSFKNFNYKTFLEKQRQKQQSKISSNGNLVDSFGPSKKAIASNAKPQFLNNENRNKNSNNFSLTPQKASSKQTIPHKLSNQTSSQKSKISISQFLIVRQISSTKYSQIFLCMDKKTSSIYCLKKIKKSIVNQSQQLLSRLVRKISIQFSSNHPNIVQIYDFFSDSQFLYIVQEYIQGGTLRDYINKEIAKGQKSKLDPKFQTNIVQKLYNINSSLFYIHHNQKLSTSNKPSQKIHGDLRPQTILLNLDTCKISPMNPTKIDKSLTKIHPYICPQAIAEQPLTNRSDMWNFGLVLYQLCTRKSLFKVKQHEHQMTLTDQIVNIDIDKQIGGLDHITYSLKEIMRFLLKIRPDQRFSSDEVMNSRVVKIYGLKTEELELRKVNGSNTNANGNINQQQVHQPLPGFSSSLNNAFNRIQQRKLQNPNKNASFYRIQKTEKAYI